MQLLKYKYINSISSSTKRFVQFKVLLGNLISITGFLLHVSMWLWFSSFYKEAFKKVWHFFLCWFKNEISKTIKMQKSCPYQKSLKLPFLKTKYKVFLRAEWHPALSARWSPKLRSVHSQRPANQHPDSNIRNNKTCYPLIVN